jgi:hypothetical protein
MLKLIHSTFFLTSIAIAVFLVLTFPSLPLNGFGQNETPSNQDKDVTIKMQLKPNTIVKGVLDVTGFQFSATNSTALCPTTSCEYELIDGQSLFHFATDYEKILVGTIKIDTGESTQLKRMKTYLQAIEGRETDDGKTIQVLIGRLDIGIDEFHSEYSFSVNGTQTTIGDNVILDLKGTL